MSTVKVFGLYEEIPYYKLKSLYLGIAVLLPFLPTIVYALNQKFETIFTGLIFFYCYILATPFVGKYIAERGKQWKTTEYLKISISSAILHFIIVQIFYAILTFIIFQLINFAVNQIL